MSGQLHRSLNTIFSLAQSDRRQGCEQEYDEGPLREWRYGMAAPSRVVLGVTKAATQLIWETNLRKVSKWRPSDRLWSFYLREECHSRAWRWELSRLIDSTDFCWRAQLQKMQVTCATTEIDIAAYRG